MSVCVPAITIRLELESEPQVSHHFTHEGDWSRMLAWFASRPDLLELVAVALKFEQMR
jgi:hypothetical protein